MDHTHYMPHGACYHWQPEILFMHVGGNLVVAISYVLLGFYIIKDKPDPITWLVFCFIICCGIGHFFKIWTIWNPDYMWEGVWLMITAAVSLSVAVDCIKYKIKFKAISGSDTDT